MMLEAGRRYAGGLVLPPASPEVMTSRAADELGVPSSVVRLESSPPPGCATGQGHNVIASFTAPRSGPVQVPQIAPSGAALVWMCEDPRGAGLGWKTIAIVAGVGVLGVVAWRATR